MKLLKKDSIDLAVIALILANTIPIFGVLYLGWDAFHVVLLYWSENLLIGFYNILKILFASVPHPLAHSVKLLIIPFFIIHYGLFTFVHCLFIFSIFNMDLNLNPMAGKTGPVFILFFQAFFNIFKQIYTTIPLQMRYAIFALFLSHGVSFVYNYFLKKEYKSAKAQNLMAAPYGRVFVMHLTVMVGGFLSKSLGSPVAILLLLIVLKTIVDINFHQQGHQKTQAK